MALTNPDFENPQIEVVSESPRLEMLQVRLREAGMRPVRADMPLDPRRASPLLLDMQTAPQGEGLTAFIREWHLQNSTRLLVILGDMPADMADLPTLHLLTVDQLHNLPARLAIRQREQARQREHALRQQTADRLGGQPTAPAAPKQRGQMLYLGEASAQFNALRVALDKLGLDLSAALSRRTATDHLGGDMFAGIILNPVHSQDETCAFLRALDGTVKQASLKVFLMDDPTRGIKLDTKDIAKASQIIPLACSPEQQANMIATIWQQMPAVKTRRTLGNTGMDGETGFHSRAFLDAHLAAQMQLADTHGAPLTILMLEVKSGAMKAVAAALPDHLRETDFAARLDPRHICITMPDTAYRGAVNLGRRLDAICADTLKWRAVERRRFHTVKTLLSAGLQPSLLHGLRRA